MNSKEFDESLEVALSGGGLRATAFGLGVLLYLIDSGLNRKVKTISSVSGGSITSGFIASECDFASITDKEEFVSIASRLSQIICGKGKFHGFWLISRPYLVILFVSGLAIFGWLVTILVGLLAATAWQVSVRAVSLNEVVLFCVIALLWGVAALYRGEMVLRWISSTFYYRKPITLGSLSRRKVDHVFCATDLTSASPIFFSTKGGGRVYSQSYGRGDGADVPLKTAVCSSAAFPPLVPPLRFKIAGRNFTSKPNILDYIYLSDGGVWNNLGTDWSRLRSQYATAERAWLMTAQQTEMKFVIKQLLQNCPTAGVLLIANASKPEKRMNLWILKIPMLSIIVTLIRVLSVTVNSTVESRAADIENTARLRMLNNPDRWELGSEVPPPKHVIWGQNVGTDTPLAIAIEMTRKPGESAKAYSMVGGLEQWMHKPDEYQSELQTPQHQELMPLWEGDDIVPTTFDNLGPRDTLRMIVRGYLNTRETLAVAFTNHNPPPLPKRQWFEDLLVPRLNNRS
jgi:predicted acylesterase/phospholipase RssA